MKEWEREINKIEKNIFCICKTTAFSDIFFHDKGVPKTSKFSSEKCNLKGLFTKRNQ